LVADFDRVIDVTSNHQALRQNFIIENTPRSAATKGADKTNFRTQTIRQAGLIVKFAVSISAISSTSSFAFGAKRSRCARAMRSVSAVPKSRTFRRSRRA
jgi:hypothetical protein